MSQYILAIDQGTTNSRAILFNRSGEILSAHDIALTQIYPHPGWVEQDPEEMFQNTVTCCRRALDKAKVDARKLVGIGISNQRETTIIWDRQTGKPIYPAIVWQDRRTSDICREIQASPIKTYIEEHTGLLIDPYFSATKMMWILQHVADARAKAESGQLLFGTVDTYLVWKLTNGRAHVTDITNASRTMLFNIKTQKWDEKILAALAIPQQLLPEVKDNVAHFGDVDKSILGAAVPIAGMAGDQQAATIGQACFHAGMVKSTYGTGCFMLLNTGAEIIRSKNLLLTTIAYRINQKICYGLEGSIFSAGMTVKWLRDQLQLVTTARETEEMAASIIDTGGVYFVPAFTGLGAPYWQPDVRGAILGVTLGTEKKHLVRAALESVAYQTRDLLYAMCSDSKSTLKTLRVDGGMAANNWFLQFLANILGLTVERPSCIETTALGVSYLAGLQMGVYQSLEEIAELWQMEQQFAPEMDINLREDLYRGWKHAIQSVLG